MLQQVRSPGAGQAVHNALACSPAHEAGAWQALVLQQRDCDAALCSPLFLVTS